MGARPAHGQDAALGRALASALDALPVRWRPARLLALPILVAMMAACAGDDLPRTELAAQGPDAAAIVPDAQGDLEGGGPGAPGSDAGGGAAGDRDGGGPGGAPGGRTADGGDVEGNLDGHGDLAGDLSDPDAADSDGLGPDAAGSNAVDADSVGPDAAGLNAADAALPVGRPVQLTDGGCCTQPFWRADGAGLWFVDRPEGGETGFWEVRLDAPGAPPALVTTTIASFSPDQRWRIDRAAGRTTLVRLADGAAFDVPAGGRTVAFAPDGARIAWQMDISGAPPERNVATIYVGTPEGGGRREVARLTRGSLSGWLDDSTLLARGREAAQAEEDILWAYPLDGGERREIARARRMRGQVLSPGGRWLIWYVAGDPEPSANGLWLAETRSGAPPPRRLEGRFGAYQWRDATRLVMVPFDLDAPSHRLIELDIATGAERPLTDPSTTAFRIANGDWSLSPDGRHVAFVSATDRNIWALRLRD